MKETQKASVGAEQPSAARLAVHVARLMKPEEVVTATATYPPAFRERFWGRWSLCGDFSTEMFDSVQAAQSSLLPMRLTAFGSPAGVFYGVISHQFEGHVHRFVLPLYEPRVRQLLECIHRENLMFMAGRSEGAEALVLDSPLEPAGFGPLLALSSEPTSSQLADALEELPLVIDRLRQPAQVPSPMPMEAVRHVEVSVLLPTQSLLKHIKAGETTQ